MIRWQITLASVAVLALVGAPAAAADDFFVGHIKGQTKNVVMIDRGPKVIEQAVFSIDEKCTLDGKKTKPSGSTSELKNAKVRKNKFKINRVNEGPSTGLNPPEYGNTLHLRGQFMKDSAEAKIRTKDFDRHHGHLKCESGKQTAQLDKVSRASYERTLEDKFPFFDPKP